MTTSSPVITPAVLTAALTYEQYQQLSTDRLAQGMSTSDDPAYNTSEILGYVKLNLHRMNRLHKLTSVIADLRTEMSQLPERWTWLVLTESWCGDAAQCIPVLDRIAGHSPHVEIRFLLRDQHLAVMDAYRTNGGRSIPKLICLRTHDLAEIGTWGPRPAGLQALMNGWRTDNLPFDAVIEQAQRWYNEDHTQSLQHELLTLVRSWSKVSV